MHFRLWDFTFCSYRNLFFNDFKLIVNFLISLSIVKDVFDFKVGDVLGVVKESELG